MVNYLPIPVVHFFILRHYSHSGQRLILIVGWKVVPTQQNLWRIIYIVRARYLNFVPPFPWVRGYTLRILRHPRPDPTLPNQPPSNWAWWTYYGLVIVQRENSYEAFLRAILQCLFLIVFLSNLNRLHIVMYQGSRTTRGFCLLVSARLRLNSISITVIFESRVTIWAARRRFRRPSPFILEFAGFRFLAVSVNTREGARYRCVVTTGIPLNTRFQCNTTKRKRKKPSSPSMQALEQQVKNTCVTIAIFCVFAACLFNQIRK